jgi:hypothetical protein
VFVADSQSGRQEANEESLEDLNANLVGHGKALARVPHTFHWNKRDLSDLVPLEELDRKLNIHHAPSLGTCATRGDGVFEGLERISRLAIQHYEVDLPKSEQPALSLGAEGSPGSIAEAIRAHAEAPLANKVTPFPGTSAVKGERHTAVPSTRSSPNGSTASVSTSTMMSLGSAVPKSSERTTDRDPTPPPAVVAAAAQASAVEERRSSADGWPAVTAGASGGPAFSMAELWPKSEREEVRQAESLIAARDGVGAVVACELLFARVLASVPGLMGAGDAAPQDAGVASLLLGLDGRRYLTFRALVRAAKQREPVSVREALDCFAFVMEARAARESVGR